MLMQALLLSAAHSTRADRRAVDAWVGRGCKQRTVRSYLWEERRCCRVEQIVK